MNQADNDFYNSINELLGYSLPPHVTRLNIDFSVDTGVSITVTYYPFRESSLFIETESKTYSLVEEKA